MSFAGNVLAACLKKKVTNTRAYFETVHKNIALQLIFEFMPANMHVIK